MAESVESPEPAEHAESSEDEPGAPEDDLEAGEDDWSEAFSAMAPNDSLSAIAAFLDSPADDLAVVTEVLDDRTLFPTGAALRSLLDEFPGHLSGAADGLGPQRWFPFDLREPESTVPLLGWWGFAGDSVAPHPLAFRLQLGPLGSTLEVFAAPGEMLTASEALTDFVRRRREVNPLRRRTVRASGPQGAISLRLFDMRSLDRERVVLPAGAWEAIDRHVVHFLERGERIEKAGFGRHAGVLVAGPSGTGKTALCRVLAGELVGRATVVFCDPVTSRDALAELYSMLHPLAPALVVIEHAESAAPLRGTDAPTALAQFLTALDLAQDAPAPIVTVLTTSEPAVLDAAARTSGRFHLTLTLTMPDTAMRRRILDALLESVEHDVDTAAVARTTEGASGADLHHLVRLAAIEGEGPVSTGDLLKLAAAKGWASSDTGMYL